MAIAYNSSGNTDTAATSTSFSLDITSASVGAVCLAWVSVNVNAATFSLTGWNAGPTLSTASTATGQLFWRVKQTGDTTFTGTQSSGRGVVVWASYTGVDTTTPYETASNSNILAKSSASLYIQTPTINCPSTSDWAFIFYTDRTSTSGNRPMTITDDTGTTRTQRTNGGTSAPWVAGAVADFFPAASGSFSFLADIAFSETYGLGGVVYLRPSSGVVNATFSATTVGTADAAGLDGAMTGTNPGAVFTTVVGTATAAGNQGQLTGFSPGATMTTLTGSATSSGGSGLLYSISPVTPALSSQGPLVTSFRVELLDSEENLKRTMGRVKGGSLTWDAYAAVKSGGSAEIYDDGDVDWLNDRLHVTAIRRYEGTALPTVEVPLGVYCCAAPTEDWTATGRSWKVELADKLSILDTDTPMDSTGLKAVTYAATVGINVVDTVVQLIHDAGEVTPAILPNPQTLGQSIVWEAGTSRLKIINDMLTASGFYSLYCDGEGQYRIDVYEQPRDRDPVYDVVTPFSKGEDSLMAPAWAHDKDIYDIPNRYVVWTQGDDTNAALTATAVNVDPDSPYSYANRGNRWFTKTETGVQAADQTALETYARRQLSSATSVSSWITASHLLLPDLTINRVARFVNPDAGLDQLCSLIKLEVPLSSTELCKSSLLDVGPYTEVEA